MRLLIEALGFTGSVWFHAPLEGAALATHARTAAAVESVLGPLEDAGTPHVTVFYMGRLDKNVAADSLPKIGDDAKAAFDGQSVTVSPMPVGWFEPSEASEGRTPIIMPLDAPGFERINARLLRRLMPYTDKQQFVDFKPHASIGYLPRTMTAAEQQAVRRILVPHFEWRVPSVRFSAGDKLLKTFRLAGA
ncbi:2'-5' RNA ligase superfamily [uncultured Caudovirales phage]|uniref:2'-5' RNA ligase superfamily n=1 Tax=uncultured Caudovirales phage TaxID=2100421 RepID=A0A6J5S5A6_9CAUD|nr:2'-5' RNA ligase superfamily [uncultured Caudovirales phage]